MSEMEKKGYAARHWLPSFLHHNPGRKLVALFLAALLYYYVLDQLGAEARFAKIPVEIELPATLYNADHTVPAVTVVISGSTAKINELSASDIRVRSAVTLDGYTKGSPYILRLHPTDVKVPSGLKVTKLEPQDIRLPHLEEVVTKRVPVAADWSFPEGRLREYSLRAQFVPETVSISGPESMVKTVKEVKIAPIPLDGQPMDNFTVTAELVPPPEVEMSVRQVEAHVEVVQKHTTRVFKSLPVLVLDQAGNRRRLELENETTVEVTVAGPPSQVTLMRDIQLRPYVDIAGVTAPGEYVLDVECRMPDDLECAVKRVFPSKVKVKIAEP